MLSPSAVGAIFLRKQKFCLKKASENYGLRQIASSNTDFTTFLDDASKTTTQFTDARLKSVSVFEYAAPNGSNSLWRQRKLDSIAHSLSAGFSSYSSTGDNIRFDSEFNSGNISAGYTCVENSTINPEIFSKSSILLNSKSQGVADLCFGCSSSNPTKSRTVTSVTLPRFGGDLSIACSGRRQSIQGVSFPGQSRLIWTSASHYQVKKAADSESRELQDRDYRGSVLEKVFTQEKTEGPKTTTEKVKQTSKDAGYLGVVILGVTVTGGLFYMIGKELISSRTPTSVFSKALKFVKAQDEVVDVFGTPIKGYGEETRRGRRRHVSHVVWKKDGLEHMRMKFYIKGPDTTGTVNLEMHQTEEGGWDYRYLFVVTDELPPRTIILVDNR